MFKRRLVLALGVLGCLLLAGCELFQQPPVASFVVDYDVDLTDPMVVNLNASASSDPNGDAITAYMWTFGDDVTILTPLDTTKTVTVPVREFATTPRDPVQRSETSCETSTIVSEP
jgi:hypothetical protein